MARSTWRRASRSNTSARLPTSSDTSTFGWPAMNAFSSGGTTYSPAVVTAASRAPAPRGSRERLVAQSQQLRRVAGQRVAGRVSTMPRPWRVDQLDAEVALRARPRLPTRPARSPPARPPPRAPSRPAPAPGRCSAGQTSLQHNLISIDDVPIVPVVLRRVGCGHGTTRLTAVRRRRQGLPRQLLATRLRAGRYRHPHRLPGHAAARRADRGGRRRGGGRVLHRHLDAGLDRPADRLDRYQAKAYRLDPVPGDEPVPSPTSPTPSTCSRRARSPT